MQPSAMRVACFTFAALAAHPVAAQRPLVASGAFLVIAGGKDTIAVERIRASRDTALAELTVMSVGTRLRQRMVAGEGGLLSRYELEVFPAGASPTGPPAQRLVFRFDGDTLRVEGGSPPVLAVTAGTMPWLNPSMALVEQIVRRARVVGTPSVGVPMLNVTGAQRFVATVERLGADSTLVTFPDVQMRLATASDGRVVGGVVPAQNLRIVRDDALAASVGAPSAPDYSAPAGAPYAAREVRVPTPRGYALAGTFTRPRGSGRVPAVVLISGSGLEDRDEALPSVRGYRPFREIADTLGRRGIAVLRLDDRGYGGSGGNGATATSVDFADDVRAALAWLRAQPDVDARRLALLGHSEGGLIAPLVAVRDSALAGIVLLAGPAWSGRRIIAYQNTIAIDRQPGMTAARRDTIIAGAMRAVDSTAVVSPWLRYFLDYDPLPTLRRVRAPVLILQGATDLQVTPSQANELAAVLRAGGNTRVTTRVFPETNHLFLVDPSGDPTRYSSLTDTHVRRDVLGAITDWLVTTLRVTR